MIQFWSALRRWWREQAREKGAASTTSLLVRRLWSFVCESMPERRRQRYGDMEYDWENRVNTTSGTVGWRARLLGLFHSPYQPTDPALFQEMMASLPIEFDQFTFVDLGSGKGRTLLMASEYPFRKIAGGPLKPGFGLSGKMFRSPQFCHPDRSGSSQSDDLWSGGDLLL